MKAIKKIIIIFSIGLIGFMTLVPNHASKVYASEVKVESEYTPSILQNFDKPRMTTFDRGSCGEFANVPKYHNRYCVRKQVPARNVTERERNCAKAVLGGMFSYLFANPITWRKLIGIVGTSVAKCIIG